MEILCEHPWSWIQVHPEPFQYFFHEPQHSHSQGWPRQEPRETRTWLIEFSKPISVKGTRLLCRSPPLAPEASSICAVAKNSMGGGWGGSRTSSGTLSREHGCPWNRDIPCRPVQHFQQKGTDFWGKTVKDLIWQAVGCGCFSWATTLSEKRLLVLMTKVHHSCGFSVPFFYALDLYLHFLHITILRSPKNYCPQQ